MEKIIKNFESVLNRMVLPKFPSLDGYEILAGEITDKMQDEWRRVFRVQVEYFTKNIIKLKEQREIEQETKSLFKMMGFPESADLRVFFSEIKDKKIENTP